MAETRSTESTSTGGRRTAPGSTGSTSTGPTAGARATPRFAADPDAAATIRGVLDGRWAGMRDYSRAILDDAAFLDDPTLGMHEARTHTMHQMRRLAGTDWPASGFSVAAGGTGDPGGAVTGIEMLAFANLSLMVKAGVQWGLFGGAVENLGTARHHERYIGPLIDLELLGCFAMTEIGHGSDVQNLETTAAYDAETGEIVVHSPTPSATKDFIGGAAVDARMAAVFAQLTTPGPDGPENHGVHCVLVPIRDDAGNPIDGVTIADDGVKGGLNGVDNGRITFDHVRVPRENLLNKYGDIGEDGTYTSPIESRSRRFFTMLGTLVRGRVSVGGSAASAAKVALEIAVRYAEQRRQFSVPDGGSDAAPEAPDGGGPHGTGEVLLMDYLQHQRRLLPLLARSYAYGFAQNELVAKMHDLQIAEQPDEHAQRELESRAAGLKAAQTWHATRAIQESREACGGAGYMAENHLTGLKADSDVFTTFEGDNTVLTQLVAKELLTGYAKEVSEFGAVGWMRFVAETVTDAVRERTAARQIIQSLIDRSDQTLENGDLSDRSVQLRMFEDREEHVLETAARRLRRDTDGDGGPLSEFEQFNSVQDHVLRAGRVHIERVVLEAFVEGIEECEEGPGRDLLGDVCTLYALCSIEDDLAWFMGHRRLSVERAKAVTRHINELCARLRPHALTLVEAFGIPRVLLNSAMLDGPGTDPVRQG